MHVCTCVSVSKVGGFIPFGLVFHIIGNETAVYSQILERDIAYGMLRAVSFHDAEVGQRSVVTDIAESNIFNETAGSGAVFLIPCGTDIKELTIADLLNTDVLEKHVAHHIQVAAAYCHAALIVYLILVLLKNVDITIADTLYRIGFSDLMSYAAIP